MSATNIEIEDSTVSSTTDLPRSLTKASLLQRAGLLLLILSSFIVLSALLFDASIASSEQQAAEIVSTPLN